MHDVGIRLTALVTMVGALSLSGCSSSNPTDAEPVVAQDDDDAAPAGLVPKPRELTLSGGHLHLTSTTRVVSGEGGQSVASYLADALSDRSSQTIDVARSPARAGDVSLELAEGAGIAAEGYELTIDPSGVRLVASDAPGLFYGAQTLRQLLVEADGVWKWPRLTLTDAPRFEWRGVMLDIARHFFGLEELKRLVDLAAFHKLNRLHLHLTDDQGWRLEIESWPNLTTIGGSTQVGGGPGGFLTRADYRELVEHAEARFITVVPEIDIPGHTNAALASYPELNESGEAPELYTGTSVGFSSLWTESEVTRRFVREVLAEVASLTPGPWLHVGGDEAHATSEEEYRAFMQWVQTEVTGLGKTLVGWEEVGAAELEAGYVAQSWLGSAKAQRAADAGAPLIVSPAGHAYLDMKYDAASPVGLSWVGFVSVERAYDWDPEDLFPAANILGVEAPLWTETVETREHLDFLMWPRLAGHAEIAWSPRAGRSWDEYRPRLARHGQRLTQLGVGYHRSSLIDW